MHNKKCEAVDKIEKYMKSHNGKVIKGIIETCNMTMEKIAKQDSVGKVADVETNGEEDAGGEYPVVEETERLYQHFEDALKATGFIVPSHPGLVMTKLRRLFNRARPDAKEVKMLRGMLASVERAAKK